MKILAFEGTAKIASVAVTENEKLLGLSCIDNGLTQSELLLPMAEDLLKSLKLDFSDIELFATAAGPGSFTGVRIGTALIKGLAFGRNIPCVSVSTIDELAENIAPLCGILVPCMDAKRSQVYNAVFKSDGKTLERLTPDRAISLAELAAELEKFEGEDIYISGDGYSAAKDKLAEHGITIKETPELLINENAFSVAKIAYRKYLKGEYTDDCAVMPTYLRVPQAERERLERLKSEK